MEAAEYKDKLLATVSHDLRTPLSGTIGILEGAMEQNNIVDCQKSIKKGLRSTKILQLLVNDLMDYVQFANNKLRMNSEVEIISEMIKDVTSVIKFQAKRKGICFIVQNEIGKDGKINSDWNRIKQVFSTA
ncbi:hypothetical protein MIDIC_490040 [Alphaproteobacteria bacterium]